MWYSLLHTMEALLCKLDLLFPGALYLSATREIMECYGSSSLQITNFCCLSVHVPMILLKDTLDESKMTLGDTLKGAGDQVLF